MRVLVGHSVAADDGTSLVVDVYLPDDCPAPVVVTRTPYGRSAMAGHGRGWARNGFGYVVQDVRGRYGSGGDWFPYRHERDDGRALVDWVAAQPWCARDIVVAGASYGSFTAWAAALAAPEKVRAVISEVPAAGFRAAHFEASGVLRLRESLGWWTEHADARTSRTETDARRASTEVIDHLPVCAIGQRSPTPIPRWWEAVHDTEPLARLSLDELGSCSIPSLHIGGWYDLFLPQTLAQWDAAGRDHRPRPARGLVVGPWRHELSSPRSSTAGGRDHGVDSQLPLGPLQVRWVREILAGRDPALTQVFLVGRNRWLERWPAKATTQRWFTHADGSLSPARPAGSGRHRFTYNPKNPTPSLGVDTDWACHDGGDGRVLFRGAPLPAPIAIVGTPTLVLTALSTAPTADWVTHLIERTEDGHAFELSEGNTTTTGGDRATIDLRPLATALPTGSRLELHISGSDFPRLARNLNTSRDRYTTSETDIADQTVISGEYATVLDLPVFEEAS